MSSFQSQHTEAIGARAIKSRTAKTPTWNSLAIKVHAEVNSARADENAALMKLAITRVRDREENPTMGMPKKTATKAAKQENIEKKNSVKSSRGCCFQ